MWRKNYKWLTLSFGWLKILVSPASFSALKNDNFRIFLEAWHLCMFSLPDWWKTRTRMSGGRYNTAGCYVTYRPSTPSSFLSICTYSLHLTCYFTKIIPFAFIWGAQGILKQLLINLLWASKWNINDNWNFEGNPAIKTGWPPNTWNYSKMWCF